MADIKNNTKKDWRKIEFLMPISESISERNGKFIIRGPAIHETTTRNGTTYVGSELKEAVSSLRDKPILKDHNNSVDAIVGRTTMNISFNEKERCIDFEGQIMDEECQKRISDGRIKNVSVGAFVNDIERVETGDKEPMLIARGIDFVEISLVAVPADPNAGFAMAMAESWNLKNSINEALKKEEAKKQEVSEIEKQELKQENAENQDLEESFNVETKWTTKFINNLPDVAFAIILDGGEKDDEGKTKPRSLRMLPHHNMNVKSPTENTSVDLPHLRNALARLPQTKMSDSMKKKASVHLEAHAKALKIGGREEQKVTLKPQKVHINVFVN